ncbi:MAG: hypothetical protein M1404_04575 [Acidobacteria bacterium]|nr:hypothetical protein [Acidobacteriota bacterium]
MSNEDHRTAVGLCADGSPIERANQRAQDLAAGVPSAGSYLYVWAALPGPGRPEPGAPEARKHPGVEIQPGQSLEDHPEMASFVLGRAQEVSEGEIKADL